MKGDNLLAFVGGALLGAGLAALFTPTTGEETRKKIKDTWDTEYDNLKSKLKDLEQKIEKKKEALEEALEE